MSGFRLLLVSVLLWLPRTACAADAAPSQDALQALRKALAGEVPSLAELAEKEFARIPLTRSDAAEAQSLLWKAHAALIRKERTEEVKDRVLKDKDLAMPFFFDRFGAKPEGGRSLWLSLHGGGAAARQVNDGQWENQKKLYKIEEGLYLAPRAPTNTWNLWFEEHIDRLFGRLIEDLIVLEDVNPDRVYVLGYSAGGDGVYQLAPRLADHWAAAAMMAGHPNGGSLLSLRNVPFALQVGANDDAYQRNKMGKEYGEQLDKWKKDDPKGYEHFVRIREGKGHWMNLEDKEALPWMAKFTRNPIPERIVWKQTKILQTRSYWLAVDEPRSDSLVIAERKGQTVEIVSSEKVRNLLLRFDDRMLDLEQPVKIVQAGKELYAGTPSRTIRTMVQTLAGRGDPKLIFTAEVSVPLSEK
jgi:hypothetical protein